MKVLFLGSPEFAAVSLRALLGHAGAQVRAVYCQPDRPVGRGLALRAGPVKRLALEQGLPLRQPPDFQDPEQAAELASWGADIFVAAAYGLILPQFVLDIPPLGVINVHASLLPEYRGAAPIQRALMDGRTRSGVTIMQVERKLDSGPILLQRALAMGFAQNAGEAHDEMAALGGRLLLEALERMAEGRLRPVPQDEARACYAPALKKSEGRLDFSRPALELHNRARGVTPWPGAQFCLRRLHSPASPPRQAEDISLLALRGHPLPPAPEQAAAPGEVLPLQDGLLPIACAEGERYGLEMLKPAGGRSMTAAEFANGYLRGASWRAV